MSNVPETYLYEVRPVGRPIVLGHGVEITARKSLYLTKEDVLKCLETAYVYRRFALREPERVTVANVDRVHRPNYIPESEWDNYQELKAVEPEVEEEETPVVEEIKEEVKEETETIEEVAEPETVEETPEEEVQEVSVESDADYADIDEEEDAEVEEITDEVQTEDEAIADLVEEDNEMGVSESESEAQPAQTNQAKYVYKKHNKKKH